MHYINYNGKYLPDTTPIVTAQNRGLRYGDGIFETIKLKKGKLILADQHWERLMEGLRLLKFTPSKFFTKEKIFAEIQLLVQKNKLKDARIRLTIIRGEGGIYDAKKHTENYIIEAINLPEGNGEFNSNGLQLCFYNDAKKAIDSFSNLKTNNYLPYFMGAIFAKENNCNDAIILNSNNCICDTTIANIFYIKNKIVYTPALTQGCVAGVMRAWLIAKIQILGFSVIETAFTKEDLLLADEVFLSNSIYNIRWVAAIENKTFANTITYNIVDALLKKETEIFC
jgi:branched-chain amino acid aminotransferase